MSAEKIYLGAGCFWGVEAILKKQEGVINTEVGYMGGHSDNPTYKQVCTGETMHAEVVLVDYDSSKISTYDLLDIFLRLHDPTQVNRQGVDVGTQYRSEIFYTNEKQKKVSQQILSEFNQANSFSKEAATKVSEASVFYDGEDYHQDYFDKNPGHLCHTLRAEW